MFVNTFPRFTARTLPMTVCNWCSIASLTNIMGLKKNKELSEAPHLMQAKRDAAVKENSVNKLTVSDQAKKILTLREELAQKNHNRDEEVLKLKAEIAQKD